MYHVIWSCDTITKVFSEGFLNHSKASIDATIHELQRHDILDVWPYGGHIWTQGPIIQLLVVLVYVGLLDISWIPLTL